MTNANKLHLLLSALNISCGLSFLLSFNLSNGHFQQLLLTYAVFVGYFANALAIFIALILCIIFIIKLFLSSASNFVKNQLYGFLNGFVVVSLWLFVGLCSNYGFCPNIFSKLF